jgi:hypothetical protein
MKHYTFGSSTAARTNNCQQWRKQSEGIPRQESGAAIDGTIVHGILEAYYLDQPAPEIVEGHRVEQDHIDLANEFQVEVEKLFDKYDVTEYEPEVTGVESDDTGGTLDMVAMTPDGETMLLIDYKTGMGVQVDPEENAQILFFAAMMLFGESAVEEWADHARQFIGVIIQPNRAGEIETREWAFDVARVEAFWKTHSANIALGREGKGALVAGTHCKFCPAQGVCPATTGQMLRLKQLDPDRIEDLAEALSLIESVKETIRAVEKLAYEQLEVGVTIPGWKLVAGRAGNTSWTDPDAALRKLKRITRGLKLDGERVNAMFEEKKIVTPTAAKKLLKKAGVAEDAIEDLTFRPPPGKHTLAPESDKRPAVLSADALADALNSVT